MTRTRFPHWKRIIGGATVLVLLAVLSHPETRYLLRAGWEEGRILLKRRPLEAAIGDSTLEESVRETLRLVRDVRAFAMAALGLDAGETYTTFADVGRDTLLLVVSGSERYRLDPYRWWYPIVGSVPYKGFFNPGGAMRQAERLEARGYDVYVREADAFSTLGWFEDPLLSTVLARGPTGVVVTVIHELAHNTLYVANATPFNESFASFVGYRGAERFFLSRGDTALAQETVGAWENQQRWMVFFEELAARLDTLYGSTRDTVALDRGRARIFDEASVRLGRPVNNAVVLAGQFYRTNLAVFDAWLERHHGSLRRTIEAISERVHETSDPFAAISSP